MRNLVIVARQKRYLVTLVVKKKKKKKELNDQSKLEHKCHACYSIKTQKYHARGQHDFLVQWHDVPCIMLHLFDKCQ